MLLSGLSNNQTLDDMTYPAFNVQKCGKGSQMAGFGRYLLFISFKKPISIPAIQICNNFNEITVAIRPTTVIRPTFPNGSIPTESSQSILANQFAFPANWSDSNKKGGSFEPDSLLDFSVDILFIL